MVPQEPEVGRNPAVWASGYGRDGVRKYRDGHLSQVQLRSPAGVALEPRARSSFESCEMTAGPLSDTEARDQLQTGHILSQMQSEIRLSDRMEMTGLWALSHSE